MHRLSFIAIFAIFLSVYLGMHYYVYVRVANGLQLDGGARLALKILFIFGAVSFFCAEILSRHSSSAALKPLWHFAMIWLGVVSLALSVFVITDIVCLFFRGQDFRYRATLASLAVLLAATAYSLYNVAFFRDIKEIHVKTDKLPGNVDRFTIAQLSDIHVNPFTSPRWLERIVDQTNALDPDVIVITGDLIDTDLDAHPGLSGILKKLRSRHGVYAITGNHEFYTGLPIFMRNAREQNITVLRNSRVTVAGTIDIAGIDDDISALGDKAGPVIRRALASGGEIKRPVVLLSHRPDTFDAAVDAGIDLQLSGHTHAGQIPPLDLIVQFAFKYPVGLFQKGASYCYTTTGTGYWGPPMRLTSRSEIVKIILEK
jgi:Predicted phosphohydrolases